MASEVASEADNSAWPRIRAAAILAGYKGPEEMLSSINRPRMSYGNVRYHVREGNLDEIAQVISKHCRDLGVYVPEWWILNGFEGVSTHLGEAADRIERARDEIVAADAAIRAIRERRDQ